MTAKEILLTIVTLFSPEGTVDSEQAYCMAINIYHESASESAVGMSQVAHTVMERVRDSRYPNSPCGVILQSRKDSLGNPKLYRCAFSWFCDGKIDNINFEKNGKVDKIRLRSFVYSSAVAVRVLQGEYRELCGKPNFYYNPSLARPNWAKMYSMKCHIGNHIFLRRETGSLY